MQKVACCQPPKLASFTVLLWQDAFCQILHEWSPPVFADENNVTFFSVCCNLVGPTLGLDSVYVFTHAWPIEACLLKFVVKANLPIGSASLVMYFFQLSLGLLLPYASGQDPTRHLAVQFSSYRGVVFQHLQFCDTFSFHQGFPYRDPPIPFALFLPKSFL